MYEHAPAFAADGIHLVSTDEMTGIQALERAAPTQPVRPGKLKLLEFEYIRHGTLSLIANWQIAHGGIGQVSIGATRNEFDFANHIANTLETDPEAGWIFVLDQLNTHQSASLVRLS
ncbi:transposase [Leptolyngbya sp. AN03gr2]|uniref:transposase n=1 Tax=unclassified Leptolyngbya TaxID=2650499 RepID=UPI003D319C5A